MESVVGKLLDVDKEARMILDDAQQYYDKTVEEIAEEKKRMKVDYEQRAKKHLDNILIAETAAAEDAAAKIREQYGQLTADIDGVYEQNHSKWEDELYKRCITQDNA